MHQVLYAVWFTTTLLVERQVTGIAVEAFVQNKVWPLIDNGPRVCNLDNVSNQSIDGVHLALDVVFGDDYWYRIPAHSPRFAPIEHVFALVKNYIREREAEGDLNPEALFDEAFRDERGPSVAGVFHRYCKNHRRWFRAAANLIV